MFIAGGYPIAYMNEIDHFVILRHTYLIITLG